MSVLTKCILIAYLALSVSALSTPHHIRNAHHHRSVAAHVAHVEVPEPVPSPHISRKSRRSNSKRCKARPSSSSSSAAPAPTVAPVNVAPAPPAPSSSSEEPAPSSSEEPTPSSSSEEPAPSPPPPAPSPSEEPAPSSSSDAQPAPTSSDPPPPIQTPSSGSLPSYLNGPQTGEGTFYATGLGACGITNNDGQNIAAVSHLLFDTFPGFNGGNPNNNPVCGRQVQATYQGKSTVVTITDRCAACAITDLDFSPNAFDEIADPAVGRLFGMTWEWL